MVAAIVEHWPSRDSKESPEIVLVRSNGWPESWFGLVTGFLEKSETPAEGCLREVKEGDILLDSPSFR